MSSLGFLRNLWETLVSSTRSNSSSIEQGRFYNVDDDDVLDSSSSSSDTGAFDQIPSDVFLQILKFLGPKESVNLRLVCKSWKLLVNDNRLWVFFLQNQNESLDSIIFAEKHLRSGYPLQTFYDQSPQLSFMHIYGQRAQLPGSVIIDGGSGYCKFGWSKYARPSGRSATFLEFGNIESPTYSRLRHFFATIYCRMQVKPSRQPIVVSIPICNYQDNESAKAARKKLKETIYSVLFDMNIPAVCAVNQASLALYAARRTSGIVVNIGFHAISVVPILRGKVMRDVGVEVVGLGAVKLTGFLKELMLQRHINFESVYTVRALKENLCYVAADYEAELSKNTQASFTVSETCFTLSKERFQTGEILFQPHIAGVHAMGLHQAVALCMQRCQAAGVAADDGWFKTVVLAGGTASLSGLRERLEKELSALPPSLSEGVKVIPPPYGDESVWFGAKMVSNISTFPEAWCMTKKQFRQKSRRNFIRSW